MIRETHDKAPGQSLEPWASKHECVVQHDFSLQPPGGQTTRHGCITVIFVLNNMHDASEHRFAGRYLSCVAEGRYRKTSRPVAVRRR